MSTVKTKPKTKAEIEEELKAKEEQLNTQSKEMDELKNQMAQMMAMMQNIQQPQAQVQVAQPTKELSSKKIKVVSLIDNEMNLTTGEYGSGKPYRFPKFGYSHRIKFDDLENIVHYHRWVFEKGYALIADREAIIELGLEDEYDEILGEKDIQDIIQLTKEEHVDMLCGMNEDMRNKVLDMIIEDISKGGSRNMAYIFEIEARVNVSIMDKVKNIKEANERLGKKK